MKQGWTYKKLGEVCDIYQPKTISAKELVDNGKYLVYGANGVIGRYNSYNHENSEVLMTCRGATCGTINVSEPCSWINGNAMVIHPKDNNMIQTFLSYHLRGIDLSDVITGAAQPQITRQSLSPKMIFVPPLAEQERIVAELELLSSIIDKKKAQLKELDQLAQSIFYTMFGDPITNPKGWQIKKLGEVTTKMGSGATPKGGNQSYKNEGISLIRSLNVHNGSFKYEDLAHIDEQQAHQLSNVIVEKNDVLFNITGASVARCCIVPSDVLPARVNQHVSILRPKKEIVNYIYLCHYLISPNSQNELILLSKSNAATREALPKSIMEKYLVPLPPLSLQQEFAEKVEAIERQKALVQQSIAETQTLFDSRMDHWFS